MPFVADIQRITRALNWIGAVALALGFVIVMWALWGTHGVDDFRTAVIIAALGFGLPSVVALSLAWLLDPLTEPSDAAATTPVEVVVVVGAADPPVSAPATAWGVVTPYLLAVVAVAAVSLLRWWMTPLLGGTAPFLTFYLAVGIAAWLGGFGPGALATILSVLVAWNWFLGVGTDPPDQLGNLVALGVFAATALALAGITATAHATSKAARRMSVETSARHASLLGAEAALRNERERMKATLEIVDDAVFLTDGAGVIDYMNPAAERLTKCRLSETRGTGIQDVVALRDVATGQPFTLLPAGAQTGVPRVTKLVLVDREGGDHAVDDYVKALGTPGGAPSSHIVVLRERHDDEAPAPPR